MEVALILLGVVALVPTMLALLFALAMWKAWWLHPLWALVIVPLGVPQISYWHLVALAAFVSAFTGSSINGYDHAKEQDDTKKLHAMIGVYLAAIIGPPFVYYLISWVMS